MFYSHQKSARTYCNQRLSAVFSRGEEVAENEEFGLRKMYRRHLPFLNWPIPYDVGVEN